MDQKPRPSSNFPAFQTTSSAAAVVNQIRTGQIVSTTVSTSSSSYVLTSANLRPVTNYTLVASTQVPVTQQFVVHQSTARTTVPQYVTTSNVRHILSASSQPSNVTYMLPSGAQIVRMNNIITTSIAGDQRPGTQFILTSSSQKANSSNASSIGSQTLKTTNAAVTENNSNSSGAVSRTLSITTSTTPILQRSNINIPKLSTAYYNQIKGNEASKISFRPKLNEQKPGTSYILTSNDWPRTKNVPISSLQKVNTNFMQIPLIQKSGTVLSTNVKRSNVDNQQQKPQHQSIRSVILPSNYRTATVSQQQGTDCKLVLNSINVSTQQVLNSSDGKPSTSSTPVSTIQQHSTNYMQIPISQKPGTIITRTNSPINIENNVRFGQQQTVRSVILPSNYRSAMVSSPRKGVDYRLILKPVLRNVNPTRYSSPRNSVRNNTLRSTSSPPVRTSTSTRVPLTRPSNSRTQNEIIANSKIKPIPLRERTSQLVISEKSIQICVDEINSKDDKNKMDLTEPALKLVQAEVTYRLFYLLRECKKVLLRSRSNVLTEESVRQVCAEYFTTFYGNKLWPLFCLKPNDDDPNNENRIWMRKHNNVNLVGWLKHPKFRNPSYIKKRHLYNMKKIKLSLKDLMKVSEVVYEYSEPTQMDQHFMNSPQGTTKIFFQSLKNNQVPFSSILPKINDNNDNNAILTPTLHSCMDISLTNQVPSTSKQVPITQVSIKPNTTM